MPSGRGPNLLESCHTCTLLGDYLSVMLHAVAIGVRMHLIPHVHMCNIFNILTTEL